MQRTVARSVPAAKKPTRSPRKSTARTPGSAPLTAQRLARAGWLGCVEELRASLFESRRLVTVLSGVVEVARALESKGRVGAGILADMVEGDLAKAREAAENWRGALADGLRCLDQADAAVVAAGGPALADEAALEIDPHDLSVADRLETARTDAAGDCPAAVPVMKPTPHGAELAAWWRRVEVQHRNSSGLAREVAEAFERRDDGAGHLVGFSAVLLAIRARGELEVAKRLVDGAGLLMPEDWESKAIAGALEMLPKGGAR